MADKKVARPEKIAGSPYARLLEFSTEHSLEQFRVVLRRRGNDGTVRVLKSYQSLDPNEIDHMVDWVPSEFGGGRFEVEITHPLDPQQRFLNWGFDVEGDPLEPRRAAQAQPGIDQALQQQQQHQSGYMPPRTPLYPPPQQGGSSISGYPMGGMPMTIPQAYYQRPAPAPVRDVRLEAELETLKKQNELLMRQMQEQQHAAEMRQIREDSNRQLQEIKSGMDQQLNTLKQELLARRPNDEGSGGMKEMFGMMMKQAEMQQSSLNMILTSQANDRKEQMENMRRQMEQDLSFRREMYDRASKEKDPAQAAQLLDMMGNQTASMLNLVSQAVNSGLLGQSEGDPAWLRAVQQGLTGLQEFGQNILQAKQQEAAMASLRQPPQPGAPRLPAQRGPQPRPVGPQAPQAAPQGQPRGVMGGPGGRAVQQAPGAPQRVPGMTVIQGGTQASGLGRPPTQAQEVPPEADEGKGDGEETTQSPPSLLVPIQRFTAAIEQGAPAEVVGDMVYTFVDFLRVNDMLPREWREVFDNPSETLEQFLKLFVPHIQPKKRYLDDIGERILELEEQYGPDAPDGEPGPTPPREDTKLRVVGSPEPPIPEQEATPPSPPTTPEPPQPTVQE